MYVYHLMNPKCSRQTCYIQWQPMPSVTCSPGPSAHTALSIYVIIFFSGCIFDIRKQSLPHMETVDFMDLSKSVSRVSTQTVPSMMCINGRVYKSHGVLLSFCYITSSRYRHYTEQHKRIQQSKYLPGIFCCVCISFCQLFWTFAIN